MPPPTRDATRIVDPKQRVARFLSRTQLLRNAPPELIDRVAERLHPHAVQPGAVIAREGDPVQAFYLIEAGTFVISLTFGGNERELARVGPGDFFGEVALLGESGRMANVRAATAGRLLSLSAEDFKAVVAQVPELAELVRRAASERKTDALRTAFELEERNVAAILERKSELSLGRSPDNDLVFDSPTVSRRHALIRVDKERCLLTDLNSMAGTFVNGQFVRGTVEIADGDEVQLGDQRLLFDRRQAVQVSDTGGIRIDALALRREVKDGRTLLQDISLTVLPGELVAIVGGSGAGKTTLMDAMSGVRPATSGQVLYNGRDYYQDLDQYRHTLGYVPQDDILHREMPLRLTLRYAAKLRLPRDTPDAAIEQAAEQALAELGLGSRGDVRVADLSGGQRKRASIGIELLTQPRVFFLDEPTSGLDPATEGQMMRLLRQLADDGRTVILTTHATKNVTLCDRIVVLARDGHLAFTGPPEAALEFFGVESFDEIYNRLEDGTPEEWASYFKASPSHLAAEAERATPPQQAPADGRHALGHHRSRGLLHRLHQFRVLSRRHFDLYARHPVNFMPLVMQPVVFTLLLLALFPAGLFEADAEDTNASFQLIYMFSFMVFLYGLLFGVQEIVKERAIFFRERMVNVGIAPYLMSKTSFLAPLLILCGAVMTFLLWLTNRLPDAGLLDFYVPLLATLTIASWAGLATSLFISSAVNTSQQATDFLTPAIAPQVLFAGALFAVPAMNFVGQAVAAITGVRWSLEAMVQVTDLKDLWAASNTELGNALLVQYEDSFNSDIWVYWLILSAFILVPLAAAALVLRKKTQPT